MLAGAIALALLIKSFAFQAFKIPSDSMVPTLIQGDRVLVNKVSYKVHDVNRGDVVVFSRPPNFEPNDPLAPKDLFRRAVALAESYRRPGMTLRYALQTNGTLLDESEYLDDAVITTINAPIKVPEGKVLVLGDNRQNSKDGRVFGPIDQDLIIGRAFVMMWSFDRFTGL